jgi:hypothetical protein
MRIHDSFLPEFLRGSRRPAELSPGGGTFPIMSQPSGGDPRRRPY